MKYQYFDGIKFTLDENTGYYLNSTIRTRLHRYVWEFYNGKIPSGYEVHHVDHDKSNNDIENLKLLPRKEHLKYHASIAGKRNVENGLLDRIRPMTKEWHSSEDGREWHRKHYEKTKDKLHEEKEFICEQCGKTYISEVTGTNRFCSNKCKSKWRRDSGIDDETRICEYCGKEFRINKYSKSKTCSKSCSAKLRHKKRKSEVD
ncbi:HNH endonuclease [Aerococcus viridans]|uniref:HNH endonuclease n=1 Tax=Aerococcus viridans TaxID=1377 RepID=A0A2N6UFW8_9LACT|nr:HNH endonuclease signature motif containing protein [Aerococcus viridans]PMC80453.1 HNH endonuclease [Aerococcus viridans]